MATGTIAKKAAEHPKETVERLLDAAEMTEEAVKVTRFLSGISVGIGLGVAIGFYFGYRFNKERIRAEAFRESEEEVESIREHYRQKELAAKAKPTVDEIVRERGYAETEEAERERPLPAPVPIIDTPRVEKSKDDGWIYARELAKRTPDHPYVIHQDEFNSSELGYSQTSYTYYAEDDVLTDTDDTPLPNADKVVGQDNLKWGHGSDDMNVVFVRNDSLELDMEICRSPKSYETEVMGLTHIDEDDPS